MNIKIKKLVWNKSYTEPLFRYISFTSYGRYEIFNKKKSNKIYLNLFLFDRIINKDYKEEFQDLESALNRCETIHFDLVQFLINFVMSSETIVPDNFEFSQEE